MTQSEKELLDGIRQMEEQAPSVGLCAMPFMILYDKVAKIIEEKERLRSALAKSGWASTK